MYKRQGLYCIKTNPPASVLRKIYMIQAENARKKRTEKRLEKIEIRGCRKKENCVIIRLDKI